jgi:hypothetical protein
LRALVQRAVLEPEREEEQHDPHLAQGRDQHIVERRRGERSEHDPGDEIERDRREARARREARTDCEHDRDRSEFEEEPRSVQRRGEDQPLTARGGVPRTFRLSTGPTDHHLSTVARFPRPC